MSGLVCNIDVDLVTVDTLTPWLVWFKENSRDNVDFDFSWQTIGDTQLSNAMRPHMDIDPNDYWRQVDLYDDLYPMEGAEAVIQNISETHSINFITQSEERHKASKVNFLHRYFSDFGLLHVHASKKWEHAADIWVEDNTETLDTLTQTHPDCKVFQMINDMNKNDIVQGAIRAQSWYDIARRL